eukprot:6415111-Amphidinium_carterae.1
MAVNFRVLSASGASNSGIGRLPQLNVATGVAGVCSPPLSTTTPLCPQLQKSKYAQLSCTDGIALMKVNMQANPKRTVVQPHPHQATALEGVESRSKTTRDVGVAVGFLAHPCAETHQHISEEVALGLPEHSLGLSNPRYSRHARRLAHWRLSST